MSARSPRTRALRREAAQVRGCNGPSRVESMQQDDERAALIALLRMGSGWAKIADSVADSGGALTVLEDRLAHEETLFSPVSDRVSELLDESRRLLDDWSAQGMDVLVFWEDGYPPQLREIHEMPPVVFTRGEHADDRRAIAVVGSRSASPRGQEIAGNIAERLASEKVTVVSGLAVGIDAAAHSTALRAGGRTVAVVGTGIDRYYPKDNRALQDEIAERGMLLSQFLPGSAPTRRSFPMRNAVMSGYAAATIVVEAGEHSGARIQARYALKHGRQVIFTKELLANEWARDFQSRPGVHVVASMDELMEVVHEVFAANESPPGQFADWMEPEGPVW
ncbi:DNA-processing protein DprA [Nocardiopsis rhodophaea]